MRHRHAVPDAPCDEDIEPALQATRRALCKGFLRERWMNGPDRTGVACRADRIDRYRRVVRRYALRFVRRCLGSRLRAQSRH